MFRKCLFLKLLFISIVHFSSGQLYAQKEEGEIIIISERVGKEIDQEEREKFKLFQGVKGFQSAVHLKLPDNRYFLKITYLDEKTGELKSKHIPQSEASMKNRGYYIDRFEEIQVRKLQNQNLSKHQTVSSASKEKKIYFTLRLGQGGFYDDRSPIGKLGGGQLALDIKPSKLPIAISISNEYYKNRRDPIYSYEIAGLVAVNMLYMAKLFKSERTNVFLGGGIGRLEVPKGENEPNAMVRGILYNFEGGINVRLFWKIGFYGIGKYLYARKKTNSIKVIDFSERIVLLGLTFNFGF